MANDTASPGSRSLIPADFLQPTPHAAGDSHAQAGDDACGCGHDHDNHGHGHHHHAPAVTFARGGPKTGRNESCPCGSGKKYKKCCLTA